MSLRLEMLRAAARLPELEPPLAADVGRFIRSAAMSDGSFPDRAGRPDLYYTVFGMQCRAALASLAQPDAEHRDVRPYLEGFGCGEGLDLVHLACLARCWAMSAAGAPPPDVRRGVIAAVERYRTRDGGFAPSPGAVTGTAYAALLALGAYQDVGLAVPDAAGLVRSVGALRTCDGGYANHAGAASGAILATAAALVVLCELGQPIDPQAVRWLLAQQRDDGGFSAMPGLPASDLLSTATALHALARCGAWPLPRRHACRRFVASLRTSVGGFRGHADDDQPDCEYTFYGLLALAHLAGET